MRQRTLKESKTPYSSPLTVFGQKEFKIRSALLDQIEMVPPLNRIIMPSTLLSLILNYVNHLPVAVLYQYVTQYKQRGVSSSTLASVMLDSFSYPDSRVAFALDDFTSEERSNLLDDVNFPTILKLYYYSAIELRWELKKKPLLKEALFFGLLEKEALFFGVLEKTNRFGPDTILKIRQYAEQNITRQDIAQRTYQSLCAEGREELIYNVLVQFAYFILKDAPVDITSILFACRRDISHLRLPSINFRCWFVGDTRDLEGYHFRGANFRGANLPIYANLNIDYSDIRDNPYTPYIRLGWGMREVFLPKEIADASELGRWNLLGAHIGPEVEKFLRSRIIEELIWAKNDFWMDRFRPLRAYFNQKFVDPQSEYKKYIEKNVLSRLFMASQSQPPLPSLQICIFFLGITRAKTPQDFDEFIEDHKKYYPTALEDLVKQDIKFWQALVETRDRLSDAVPEKTMACSSSRGFFESSSSSSSSSSAVPPESKFALR